MSTNYNCHVLLLTIYGLWIPGTPVSGYNSLPLSRNGGSEVMECYDCYSVVENDNGGPQNEQVLGFACFHYLDADRYPDELNHTEASKRFRYFTVNSGVQSGDLYCTTITGQVIMKPYGFLPWECNLGLCMDIANAVVAPASSKIENLEGQKTIRMKPPGVKLRSCVGASVNYVLDHFQQASKTSWESMIGGLTFRSDAAAGKPVTDLEICRCKESKDCKVKMNRLLFPGGQEEGRAGVPQELSNSVIGFAFFIIFLSYF